MSSGCISSCVQVASVPVRANYVNLYRWPESDAEFVRSVSSSSNRSKVVDSISCRQMYLRSYTFSKKESVPEKTKKCFGRVKVRVAYRHRRRKRNKGSTNVGGRKKCCIIMKKMKEFSCAALLSFFNRLLTCTASVDVLNQRDL
ncbi:hypothetical protein AQUCO_01000650v1 [Aquilegia coerulea]|uniref:Uncharacterized protein n=1 Tax=Aquilegia coerulea TaxID=218851 RepID=A0A2G5EAZ7_AQUCA|nr:hypothetical protein AQUCO_01000650v1 [Aquilegia coerulea]